MRIKGMKQTKPGKLRSFAACPQCSTGSAGAARGSRPGHEHGAKSDRRTERLRRPRGWSVLAGYNASTRGRVRVPDRSRPAADRGASTSSVRPRAGERQWGQARCQRGAPQLRRPYQLDWRAPCHALPGRVGEEGSVNQAYDLAWCQSGWRRSCGDLRPRRSNKRMQQTRGGWRRGGASWPAQSPRTGARSCAPRS
jgi:hypothetical protein